MKKNFKSLALTTAVAAVVTGYAGVSNAQIPAAAFSPLGDPSRSIGDLGDMAIVPYYTVRDNWVTGVHIINTSDRTQVVKLRLRRASDSADALDFNLIMSPEDEWTGFIDDSSGDIVMATQDTTCTAPIRADGRFPMPFIFREGAEEGYIEVIGMGSPQDEDEAIAVAAKHGADGVPKDCASVATNFFFNDGDSDYKGVYDNEYTYQEVDEAEDYDDSDCDEDEGPALCENEYEEAGDVLKVSYFFRDATAGAEFGGNAVHISGSSAIPWMSNQEFGLFSGDVTGFDYPDLNGGPLLTLDRGLFQQLRDPEVLGVASLLNDWSIAPARNVSTDWVVTMPGQYAMVDYYVWAAQAGLDLDNCGQPGSNAVLDPGTNLCDFRDLPVSADLVLYDREEGRVVPEDGDLVISPAPPGERNVLIFPNEVNVVNWNDGSTDPVLPSEYSVSIDPSALGESGWASLQVHSSLKDYNASNPAAPGDGTTPGTNPDGTKSGGQAVCIFNFVPESANVPLSTQRPDVCEEAEGSVPVVGFVAWQRSFPSNPDANYGRLIEHSFTSN